MTPNYRIRMTVVGVTIPLLIALAGVIAVLVSLPQLPNPVAVHWGTSGAADGFGPPWLALILPPVVVLLYTALVVPVIHMTDERHVVTANQKLILSIASFLAVVVTGVIAGSTVMQRGLADAASAPSVVPLLLTSFGIAIACAWGLWFVLPPVSPPSDVADEVPTLDLDVTARGVWIENIGPSRSLGIVLIVVVTAAAVGGAVALWLTSLFTVFLVYAPAMAAVVLLTVGTVYWTVTIDSRGIRVVSALGFPRFVIALADIESGVVTAVPPIGHFGGWGLRWGGRGRTGIILRSGEALQVKRTNGRALVVTVSRAATAAALLNALARRA